MPRLLSVNVGLPRDLPWRGEIVHTGIWKEPVRGPRMVRRLNIDGDGQGDHNAHGGEHRAVFVYQIESYQYWERQLHRSDFVFGQFGENLTVEGLSDEEVCIGDQYRIGDALFEVTQPRVTCYRVGIRMNEPQMPALLVAHKRPGFYLRVLQEGKIQAGDDIVKAASGPERMTIAEIDAMLYLGKHSHEQLERAIRIPALSAGWKASFQALLEQELTGRNTLGGNAGLGTASGPPPAWQGFRSLRVARFERESKSIVSLVLVPTNKQPLAAALPGQFVVLRLHPTPEATPLLRNYSLSDTPATDHYRVSIKQEMNGVASTYVHTRLQVGDEVEVSAPRGSFTLGPGPGPVVLLSAGVGATPTLAMLHTLATESSKRGIWWVHGARNRDEHPFAQEVRTLLQALPNSHSHILYSKPDQQDRPGLDFDAIGRVSVAVLKELGVPREADFYLCGPATFLHDLTNDLTIWGVTPDHLHSELFGSTPSTPSGLVDRPRRSPHPPARPGSTGPLVSFVRSGLVVHWDPAFENLLELAEACDVPVKWSCRMGVCHMCESRLISGSIQYQPKPLDPPAEGTLLICCSQPRDEVTLDL